MKDINRISPPADALGLLPSKSLSVSLFGIAIGIGVVVAFGIAIVPDAFFSSIPIAMPLLTTLRVGVALHGTPKRVAQRRGYRSPFSSSSFENRIQKKDRLMRG